MKTVILIALGIIAILVISGCTQLENNINPICNPNYVNLPGNYYYQHSDGLKGLNEEGCKSACFDYTEVTSYKFDLSESSPTGIGIGKCYCDINDCNPRSDIE